MTTTDETLIEITARYYEYRCGMVNFMDGEETQIASYNVTFVKKITNKNHEHLIKD
jgi:hypothetical protein